MAGGAMTDNRARLTITQPGKPELYQLQPLPNWEAIGTVIRGESDAGALVRNLSTGIYAQANAGAIRSLDQRKILAALGLFANATKLDGGKRVNVYLDEITLERAKALGGGNVSDGIRKALLAHSAS